MSSASISTPKVSNLAERLDSLPLSRWHAALMTICYLGLVFDGFDSYILAAALPQLGSLWKLTPVEIGLLGSAGFIGMLIGALGFGMIADRIGRLKVLIITLLTYALVTGACSLAQGFTSLFALRVVVGLGLGGLVPVDSSYLTEYLPSKCRGRFMAWFNGFFSVGVALAFLAGPLVIVPFGWRWGFVIGILPALLVAFVRRNLPESTRYLLARRRIADAVQNVENIERAVLGRVTVPTEAAIRLEEQAPMKGEAKVPIADLFKPGVRRSTIVLAILWFCINYSGYAITVWLPVLLTRQMGYKLGRGLTFLAIAQLISCTGHFSAGWAADFFGRKFTLGYSFLLYGASTYFFFWYGKDPAYGSTLLIVMLIFLGSSFATMYAFSPESFPTRVRGTGTGFAGAVGRLGGMLGPTFVGIIYGSAGLTWVLHVNMMLLVFAVVVLLIFARETRRRSLEEIEAAAGGNALAAGQGR